VNGAKPGIAMQAYPNVGRSYRQEYGKGRAEDFARVIDLKGSVEVQRTGRGRPPHHLPARGTGSGFVASGFPGSAGFRIPTRMERAMTTSTEHLQASNGAPFLLSAENLQKAYDNKVALKGLSFSLRPGRIMGFLGPNGAGKTTAIRILTTVLQPTAGKFSIAGISHDEPDKIREVIGVLPESHGFPENVTGTEYLTYFGRLYGQRKSEAKRRAASLLREVALENRARSLVSTYSRGMKQRLGIARALINEPPLLFLDEPTLGLDPRGQRELLVLLRSISRDHGAGIILCSHLLSEIEEVCDDVIILRSGEIVASGTVAEVMRKTRHNNVQIRIPEWSVVQAKEALEGITGVVRISQTRTSEALCWLDVELEETAVEDRQARESLQNELLAALVDAEIPVSNYSAEGVSLQDVFLQLTGEEA
jgi:ABC-2 type transport system ATP-binding protein